MSISSKDTIVASSPDIKQDIFQNFRLFWLDANIDESNEDFSNSFDQLQRIVTSIDIYTDIDECVKSLREIKNDRVFMIVSGSLGQNILEQIHNMSQLDSVFVFCSNKPFHEQWALKWKKVKGVFTDIVSICGELNSAVRQCDHNSVSISFLSVTLESNASLSQLDYSFMCIQLFKENILQMQSDSKHEEHIKNFVIYCQNRRVKSDREKVKREKLEKAKKEKSEIEDFRKHYRSDQAIEWYKSNRFLASTLNWALHTLEVKTILKMSFFIHDLHQNIIELHNKQNDYYNRPLTVYRGQSLSNADFEKLKQTKNGLMSFNNFLLTSTEKNDSLDSISKTMIDTNTVGVIFIMNINPMFSTIPYARTKRSENEIIFSLHTVFQIDNIQQLDENNRLWEVQLTLVPDNDKQLAVATKLVRNETWEFTDWDRLGELLSKFGEFDKAKEIYNALIDLKRNDKDNAHLYQQLGRVERQQGAYNSAIESYKKAIEIYENGKSREDANLANSYNNIGLVYENIRDYQKALESHEKARHIRTKILPSDHPSLAASYSNIGNVYNEMCQYADALSSHQKALDIREKILPPNHPNIANSYNNLGLVYFKQEDYSKALANHEKALEIRQNAYPPNYYALAGSYNNIGLVNEKMGDYSKARFNYEEAITTAKRSLSSNHPHLIMYQTNYARVKDVI